MQSNLSPIAAALPSAVIDRDAMTRAVEVATNAVEKRSTYPVLANLRLMGDGNGLFVIGTNLDLEIVVAVPAAADADFDVTIPADLLKTLLKGAPKAEHVAFTMPSVIPPHKLPNGVEVGSAFDGEVAADFDKVRYDLVAIHPDAFPTMKAPSHNEARRFSLAGAVLLDALNSVAVAISNEETRYYLNGICVQDHPFGDNPGLRFVATDGHRMMGQIVDRPEGAADLPAAIWPKQLVFLLQKLLKGKTCPESVSIEIDETKIRVAFGDVTITSKLIEGTFPDVDRVTPRHNPKVVRSTVKAMQEAAAAVVLISTARGGRSVRLQFDGDRCDMSVISQDNGSARMSLPVGGFDGYLEIGFNARYFDDILEIAAAGGDDLSLAFNDSGSPTFISGSKAGWYAVLMPMRV